VTGVQTCALPILLHKDKPIIAKALIKKLLPRTPCYLPIIVDESVLDARNERKLLRFSLALSGRSYTLYEVAYTNGSFSTGAINFLLSLNDLIPTTYSVVIISDAGFFAEWFKKINTIPNWYWLGRVSQNYCYRLEGKQEWQYTLDLYSQATSKPSHIGEIIFTKLQKLKSNLYIYKDSKKGRKKHNKLGKTDLTKTSIEKRKSANGPWLLVTSLPADLFSAEKIISLYKLRMQIEEQFRDLKSSRYGFSFEMSMTKDIYRLNNLLFIGHIAMVAVWITGVIGESKKRQYYYQSNTIKCRRVLSLIYLGHEICKNDFININRKEFREAFNLLPEYVEQTLGENHHVQI